MKIDLASQVASHAHRLPLPHSHNAANSADDLGMIVPSVGSDFNTLTFFN